MTAAALAAVMGLAACGGGGAESSSSSSTTTSISPNEGSTTTGTTGAPSNVVETELSHLAVDRTAYLAALRIDLTDASVDRTLGQVVLEGRVTNENPFDDSATDINARTTMLLEAGDARIEIIHDLQVTPVGSSSPFRWVGNLPDEPFPLDDARLVLGAGTENQSLVPLGDGMVETFEPASGFADNLEVATSAAHVRVLQSIRRSTYTGSTPGGRTVDLEVEATGLVSQVGGYRINGDNLALIDGDGNTIVGQGPQDGVLFLSVINQGTKATGWVSFRIDEASGPFTLQLSTPDVAGTAPATTPIDVP